MKKLFIVYILEFIITLAKVFSKFHSHLQRNLFSTMKIFGNDFNFEELFDFRPSMYSMKRKCLEKCISVKATAVINGDYNPFLRDIIFPPTHVNINYLFGLKTFKLFSHSPAVLSYYYNSKDQEASIKSYSAVPIVYKIVINN